MGQSRGLSFLIFVSIHGGTRCHRRQSLGSARAVRRTPEMQGGVILSNLLEGPGALTTVIAVVVVLILLALAFWLVRRFGGGRLGGGTTRGRQPRLAVIDQATVDGRRRLVLIRRDNVEHLLIIGGPTD